MRERSLGPLMVTVHKLRVVGQAFIVTDVLVQGISIVSCVKRTEELLLSAKTRKNTSLIKCNDMHSLQNQSK